MFAGCIPLNHYRTPTGNRRHQFSSRRIRRREKPVRFEIMRLDDVNGSAVDTTVVDEASVNRIVQQAAAMGQRIYIRPAEAPAS